MLSIYRSVMDSNVNPLRHLPAGQRFQVMFYLSLMWTLLFCIGTGAWIWFGEILAIHVPMVLGLTVTGLTFRHANIEGKRKLAAVARG